MRPTSSYTPVHILYYRELGKQLLHCRLYSDQKGDGVRRGGLRCLVIIVAVIDQDIGGRSRRAFKLKTGRGGVTWDSDLNLRDPARKYYTDPYVYTETLRFTACINTQHTVLYMVVSLLDVYVWLRAQVDRQSEGQEQTQRHRQSVWTIGDLYTVNHNNSSLWKFP